MQRLQASMIGGLKLCIKWQIGDKVGGGVVGTQEKYLNLSTSANSNFKIDLNQVKLSYLKILLGR